jgi:hypothetical protein
MIVEMLPLPAATTMSGHLPHLSFAPSVARPAAVEADRCFSRRYHLAVKC